MSRKTVPELQRIAQVLKNELFKRTNGLNTSQVKELEKAFRIIFSVIGKLQKKKDKKETKNQFEIEQMIDSAIPRGPEHIGETEPFYQ